MRRMPWLRAAFLGFLLAPQASWAQAPAGAPNANAPSRSNETPQTGAEAPPRAELELPKTNQGHFIALGLQGVGAMAWDATRGTRSPTAGAGFSVRLGESVTSWLDLGLAFAWASTAGPPEQRFSFGRLGLQSQWYPHPDIFVPLGFGATSATGPDPEDLAMVRSRYGAVFWTGVGANIPLSSRTKSGGWIFTPVITWELAPEAQFTSSALWLGLELSWWSGLPASKLHLPASEAYKPTP
jgi:hypothetical protein